MLKMLADTQSRRDEQQTSSDRSKKPNITSVIDELIESKGYATVSEVAENAHVTKKTASRYLSKMTDQGILVAKGTTRDRKYFKR